MTFCLIIIDNQIMKNTNLFAIPAWLHLEATYTFPLSLMLAQACATPKSYNLIDCRQPNSRTVSPPMTLT